ncbi:hypothetical protein J2T57_002073 [Natronocella acetinitrilica]|uniref:Uncharacterized protein n=1 Tax=Natronocella acetinitrilica TaxID=414046 RepID=A0AAE3G341_9GAMM|nr:hypothetical protein [Natronocella acetinitrilica]MCP1674935.1 hypothetical protein [Natronocella acetinitrilica]
MTRLTGFIAFAIIVTTTIVMILRAQPDPLPEPHASCLQLHRDNPRHTLGPLGRTDLLFEQGDSSVTERDNGDGERIVTHMRPAARSAGESLDLVCYRDGDGAELRLEP